MSRPRMAHKTRIDRPWTPAAATDISKTFARIRREQQESKALEQANVAVRQIALVQKAKA